MTYPHSEQNEKDEHAPTHSELPSPGRRDFLTPAKSLLRAAAMQVPRHGRSGSIRRWCCPRTGIDIEQTYIIEDVGGYLRVEALMKKIERGEVSEDGVVRGACRLEWGLTKRPGRGKAFR